MQRTRLRRSGWQSRIRDAGSLIKSLKLYMWEEHPAYQKAQAKIIGLLVLVLFIGSVVYCVSKRDWDLLRLVLYAGAGLVVALAVFPLFAWIIVRALGRHRPSRPPKSQPNPGE